jgi:hypothetical protein
MCIGGINVLRYRPAEDSGTDADITIKTSKPTSKSHPDPGRLLPAGAASFVCVMFVELLASAAARVGFRGKTGPSDKPYLTSLPNGLKKV